MKKFAILFVMASVAAMPVASASASEDGAEYAVKRVIKRERGYTPSWISCHRVKKGRYRCAGNTAYHDGSYAINCKVKQKGQRYKVYALRI